MIEVGDKVMVRDNWIQNKDYRVPQAEVIGIKNCAVLFRKTYLIKFDNGVEEWFDDIALKSQ